MYSTSGFVDDVIFYHNGPWRVALAIKINVNVRGAMLFDVVLVYICSRVCTGAEICYSRFPCAPGLQVSAAKFFIFLLDLFLGTLCTSAIAFLVSASVGVFAIANIVVVLILIVMMVGTFSLSLSPSLSLRAYVCVRATVSPPGHVINDVTTQLMTPAGHTSKRRVTPAGRSVCPSVRSRSPRRTVRHRAVYCRPEDAREAPPHGGGEDGR